MDIVTIHAAKTNLSQLIARVEAGEEIALARGGNEPTVKLVPLKPTTAKREPGLWRGKVTITPAFFEPLPPDEIEAWDQ